jgi:septal ring factor EnvC (AmiA/AmiB activator)
MENSDINLNNPVVQLEVMKERLRHAEEKISQQEESFRQSYLTIGRLETQLKQTADDFHDMRVKVGVTEQKLTHAERALTQSSQQTTGTDRQKKWRVFLASIFFAIASALIGIGGSQIAATPPNAFGDVLIGLGILAYIVATTLTISLA